MTMTIEDVFKKLDRMQYIVDRIEAEMSIDDCKLDIAELLDDYAMMLRNLKVNV